MSQGQGQSYLQALSYNNQVNIAQVTANAHNSLAHTQTYQRNDFKNRRSSSEPGNEQKLTNTNPNQNPTTTTTTSTTENTNEKSVVVDDSRDDFIECLQNISTIKVSKYIFICQKKRNS